jgi:DHA1 family solute carrier family 18 vesicular amine transporter 1/2
MGLTIGSLVGPPVAGSLYKRWGFRAPFIFGIIVTGIDLLARLLLIERHEAMRWGIDPMAIAASGKEKDPEAASGVTVVDRAERSALEPRPAVQELARDSTFGEGEGGAKVEIEKAREGNRAEKQPQESKQPRVTLLPHIVLLKLMRSPRAAVCFILTLIWGLGWAGQETAVVLHLNRVWGLDPHGAGTAFIAAVVPTIFCESRVLSLSCNVS